MTPTLLLAAALAASDAAGHGAVTLRFKNTNAYPVYLDVTSGNGIQWPHSTQTASRPCSEGCDCRPPCAPPLPRVKELAPGAVVEGTWDGRYFEGRECRGDRPGPCSCVEVKLAPVGRYQASLAAARGHRPPGGRSTASGDVTENAVLDGAGCTARAAFELAAQPRTLEVAITCEGPQ